MCNMLCIAIEGDKASLYALDPNLCQDCEWSDFLVVQFL